MAAGTTLFALGRFTFHRLSSYIGHDFTCAATLSRSCGDRTGSGFTAVKLRTISEQFRHRLIAVIQVSLAVFQPFVSKPFVLYRLRSSITHLRHCTLHSLSPGFNQSSRSNLIELTRNTRPLEVRVVHRPRMMQHLDVQWSTSKWRSQSDYDIRSGELITSFSLKNRRDLS